MRFPKINIDSNTVSTYKSMLEIGEDPKDMRYIIRMLFGSIYFILKKNIPYLLIYHRF